jgi:predicted RNase H-like nuclease (RuvC/YqgF family)
VIVRVNGQTVNDAGDFTHALRGRKDNPVTVNIIRDKKEQTLTLTLPERKQSEFFDESFDLPEIDAETPIDLSQVGSEVAHLKPEMERAAREMHLRTAEIERMRPELERAASEIRSHQRELKKQMLELQRELRHRQREFHRELKREFEDNEAEI